MSRKNIKPQISVDDALISSMPPDVSEISANSASKVNLTIKLRSIPLLAQLSAAEMARVKKELTIRRYSRQDVVLKQGVANNELLFLLSGSLQLFDMNDEGKVIGFGLLSPGDFMGETSLINRSASMSSVVALTDVLIALLPGATALHLFSNTPSVAAKIQRYLAEKNQRNYKFRSLLSIGNAAKRIVSLLAFMKQKTAEQVELVEDMPTHQDIANMINTSRETVTRTLLMLVQQGVVRKEVHRLIIISPDRLQELLQQKKLPKLEQRPKKE